MHTCPDTGRGVTTGISTDDSTLTRLGVVPVLRDPHVIKHKEAMLVHLQVATFPPRNSWAALATQEAERA